jgi:hypothetical protein
MEVNELIKAGLGNAKRAVDRTLDGITKEELNWHPRPDANSIGLILFHMARSEDSFVNVRIQGKPQIWESGKWYQKLNKAVTDTGSHYTVEQVVAFIVPELIDLLDYSDAVRQQTLEYLKDDLTPEKLDKKVNLPPIPQHLQNTSDRKSVPLSRPPFEPFVGSLLIMTVTHLAQHAGEISYLRGLKRGMDK